MKLYTIETRNFEFTCFADDLNELTKLMTKAWKTHCFQYRIDFDQDYLNGIIKSARSITVKKGVFRDNEEI